MKITKGLQNKLLIQDTEYNFHIQNKGEDLITLELENGSLLKLQKTHPIFTNDGMKQDLVILYDGILYHVEDIKQNGEELNLILK